ncbi:uncharacterized protein CC84DRAFT_6991 [Paraphaeosphaeria sporulosa]|uniref:Uncharacterized protein n=1 Tax=Paraphaeosphaeria sporulosa TaxID=1460663 RepID=A0A177CUR7_9PLEO|nr:uncharacterized protein CC84DRAFT_6991 [Paraphaeosphaeria sporulosa]OAG11263.1 hypothetical protein CC84DRAFT_6991 [Paraphaeosphaeria sporulosa]
MFQHWEGPNGLYGIQTWSKNVIRPCKMRYVWFNCLQFGFEYSVFCFLNPSLRIGPRMRKSTEDATRPLLRNHLETAFQRESTGPTQRSPRGLHQPILFPDLFLTLVPFLPALLGCDPDGGVVPILICLKYCLCDRDVRISLYSSFLFRFFRESLNLSTRSVHAVRKTQTP